jgi:hypothetical protein
VCAEERRNERKKEEEKKERRNERKKKKKKKQSLFCLVLLNPTRVGGRVLNLGRVGDFLSVFRLDQEVVIIFSHPTTLSAFFVYICATHWLARAYGARR